MEIVYSNHFKRSFKNFSLEIRRKFEKQIIHLLRDIRYPSLRVKRYDESHGIWQARVDKNIRFYFIIKDDVYILLDIKYHSD